MQICKAIRTNVCLYLITLFEYTYRDSVPRKQIGRDVRLGLVGLMVPMSLQEELFNYSNKKKDGRQRNDVFPVEDGGLTWELGTLISKKRI